MTKYARIRITGDGLTFATTLNMVAAADVIAYIDAAHRKEMLGRKPVQPTTKDTP